MPEGLTIDKGRTAIVVIDLQKGIATRPAKPHDSADVVANAAKLVDAFRKNGMPVFLVHVNSAPGVGLRPITDEEFSPPHHEMPPDWADFVPELKPAPSDVVITKRQWGAFYGTELDLQLRRRGISTIVLCGISTCIGVESTARDAYERGYDQVFVEDATSARSVEEHQHTMTRIFPRLGRVRSTSEVLAALKGE